MYDNLNFETHDDRLLVDRISVFVFIKIAESAN